MKIGDLESKVKACLTLCLLVMKSFLVNSAPKLGPVLFDPLLFEASKVFRDEVSDIKLDVNIRASRPGAQSLPKEESDVTDDYLEHKDESKKNFTISKISTTTRVVRDTASAVNSTVITNDKPFTLLSIIRRNYDSGFGKKNMSVVQRSGYEYNPESCKQIKNRILCGYDKNSGGLEHTNPEAVVEIGDRCRVRGDRIECGYLQPPFENFPFPPLNSQQLNADIKAKYVLRGTNETDTNETNTHNVTGASIEDTTALFVFSTLTFTGNEENSSSSEDSKQSKILRELKSKNKSTNGKTSKISSVHTKYVKSDTETNEDSSDENNSNEDTTSNESSSRSIENKITSTTIETKFKKSKRGNYKAKSIEEMLTGKGALQIERRANSDDSTASLLMQPTTNSVPLVTRCVEKGDRVVCYPIRGGLRLGDIPTAACKTCS